MSDAAALSREDRVWPHWAFTVSLLAGLVALAGSAALVASAYSPVRAVELTFIFFVTAWLAGLSYVDATRAWLRGEPVPRRTKVVQPVLWLVLVAAFVASPTTGAATLCGYLAGVFLPLASTIRSARVNRVLIDHEAMEVAQETTQETTREHAHPATETADPATTAAAEQGLWRPARRVPKVSQVLLETFARERDVWLAWAAATALVVVGGLALGASLDRALALAMPGLAALVWVGWRLVRTRLAQRDFERAATEPRQAYVVLVADPNLRTNSPVLGVWSELPVAVDGRLPRAEAVFRCDAHADTLVSRQGFLVMHEAWLDTGRSPRARPRWVAADAGIALPQRRSLLGGWYLASLLGTERPPRSRALTMRAPNPTTEHATGTVATVIGERTTGGDRWMRLFAWRLAGLAAAAVFLAWVNRGG